MSSLGRARGDTCGPGVYREELSRDGRASAPLASPLHYSKLSREELAERILARKRS
jgi:hypothetical protein